MQKRLLIRRDFQNRRMKWSAYTEAFHWKSWLAIAVVLAAGLGAVGALRKSLQRSLFRTDTPVLILLLTLWILVEMLNSYYRARLTSYLTVHVDDLPIRSLTEAVSDESWTILAAAGASITLSAQVSGKTY